MSTKAPINSQHQKRLIEATAIWWSAAAAAESGNVVS
jgi:hypothetical protein